MIHDATTNLYNLYATKVTAGEHRIDGAYIAQFDAALWQSDFKFQWQKINDQDVALNIFNETNSYQFNILGDTVYNGHLHNRVNKYGLDIATVAYDVADFPDGGYIGYKNNGTAAPSKYFGAMVVWRVKTTGTYIKHTAPSIREIPQDASNTAYPVIQDLSDTWFDSDSYTDRLLLDSEKSDEMGEAYVAITLPFISEDEAANTGDYFVVGKLDDFDLTTGNYAIKVS